jgi:hypothetical protein
MTVHQVVTNFEKANNYQLPQWHKKVVGGIIKKQFLLTYPDYVLPLVISSEIAGSFKVPDYPDTFVDRMIDMVSCYVEEILAQKSKKVSQKIIEKPSPSPHKKIASSDPQKSEKRERKRIPINKPAYSGNYKKTNPIQ